MCLDEYTATYEPDDQMEWSLVLGEIRSFIEADTVANVLDSDSNSIVLSHRLNPLITPPVERSPIMTLSLQEVIIVGNVTDQIKFSELTLDMFRMLQTLEREPQDEMAQVRKLQLNIFLKPLKNILLLHMFLPDANNLKYYRSIFTN